MLFDKDDKIIAKIFLVFLVLIGVFFVLYNISPSNEIKCVDGDTFAIGKTYYRLSYMDTPEKGEPGYKRASLYTCGYLKDTNYKLIKHGRDKYNRILVEVSRPYYGTETLNEALVKECLAEPFYGKTTQNILDTYNRRCK